MAAMASDTASPGSHHALRSRWRARATTLITSWLILLGLVMGVGRLITGPLKKPVGSTDTDVARWFAGERASSLNQVAESITWLGETITIIALAAVIALSVWIWRRNIRLPLFVAVTTGGASAIYIITAYAVPRARPPVKILDPGLDPTQSYPSGHVAAATAMYGLIVVLIWTCAHAARWWVAPLLLAPALVAVARLYAGAHHLSDVLTSAVYASIWLTITAMTLLRYPTAVPPTWRESEAVEERESS